MTNKGDGFYKSPSTPPQLPSLPKPTSSAKSRSSRHKTSSIYVQLTGFPSFLPPRWYTITNIHNVNVSLPKLVLPRWMQQGCGHRVDQMFHWKGFRLPIPSDVGTRAIACSLSIVPFSSLINGGFKGEMERCSRPAGISLTSQFLVMQGKDLMEGLDGWIACFWDRCLIECWGRILRFGSALLVLYACILKIYLVG